MKAINMKKLLLAAIASAAVMGGDASAALLITEVDPAGSGQSAYAADWFELTNSGTSAVDITGWKMDDNSNSFANAVGLRGVTSIAAGQSVVFIEGNASGSTDATIDANFITAWFGSNAPAGLTIGNYGGSGVGLSQTADAVNIFDGSGTLMTRVDFGADSGSPIATFDNAAGLDNVTLTQKSVVGVNGAFLSASGLEIGSPGTVAAVPEPGSYALLLAGFAIIGFRSRRKSAV